MISSSENIAKNNIVKPIEQSYGTYSKIFKWDRLSVSALQVLKYRGPILHVMSPALGSDDSSLDQSATSIQILLWSRDTFLIKLRLYDIRRPLQMI